MKKMSISILIFCFVYLSLPFTIVHAKSDLELKETLNNEQIKEVIHKNQDDPLESIAWNHQNTYVAGGRNLIYVSDDGGNHWKRASVPLGKDRHGKNYYLKFEILYWDGSQFVAVDWQGTILTSKDGHDWKTVFEPTYELAYFWETMQKVNGKYIGSAIPFVLVDEEKKIWSQQGAVFLESSDLNNWEVIHTQAPDGVKEEDKKIYLGKSYRPLYSMASNGIVTVAGGNGARFVYNNNGQWIEHPFDIKFGLFPSYEFYKLSDEKKKELSERYGEIEDIIWNGEKFIGILNHSNNDTNSFVYSSVDGVSWEKASQIEGYKIKKLVSTDFGAIIFGNQPYPKKFIGFSTDGSKWGITDINENLKAAVWNGKELIAVGSGIFHMKIPQELYYDDFQENQYWSEDILWAMNTGLVSGYKENGKYLTKPNNMLTEAEALTILYRYFEPDALKNTAPKTDWWASVPYQLAEKDSLNVLASYKDQQASSSAISRGKLAELLASKHFGKKVSVKEAVQFMYDANITSGYTEHEGNLPNNFESFGADKILMRAHIVSFLKRYQDYIEKL